MKSKKATKKSVSSAKKRVAASKAATPKTAKKATKKTAQKAVKKTVKKSVVKTASKKAAKKAIKKTTAKTVAKKVTKKTAAKTAASRKASVARKVPASKKAAQKSSGVARPAATKKSAGKAVKRLSAHQKENFKNLLLAMRERLSASIKSLKSESLATKDWVNLEEDGTDIFDQQFALNIVSSENEMLIQIDEALSRLDANEYGLCEDCGCVINPDRLKALPFAKTCIACQSQKEGRGRYKSDPMLDGFK